MLKVLEFAKKAYKFKLLPEMIPESMKQVPDSVYPINSDANAFWDIIKTYVAGFINEYFKTDADLFKDTSIRNFCDLLSHSLGVPKINRKDRFIDVLSQVFILHFYFIYFLLFYN